MKKNVDASIIIPCFNEEQSIEKVINDIHRSMMNSQSQYEIIVVDDNSNDRTREILKGLKNVKIILNDRNLGAGASRLKGIDAAKYDIIVYIDADASYTTDDIPRLLHHFPESDQVIGYRDKEMGTFPFLRKVIKAFARYIASLLVWEYIADLNSGLRAFKKEKMSPYFSLLPNGFSCVSTMTVISYSLGHKVSYISTQYEKRIGQSKFNPFLDTARLFLTIIRTFVILQKLKVAIIVGLVGFSIVSLCYLDFSLMNLLIITFSLVLYAVISMWLSKNSMRFE